MVRLLCGGLVACLAVACSAPAKTVPTSPPASVPEAVTRTGVVTYADGDVTVLNKGTWTPVDVGSRVSQSATIKTGVASTCDVQFGQLGTIRLAASTQVSLKTVALGRDQKNAEFELAAGTVAAKVNKLLAGQTFQIRSKIVNAGVRGTRFLVSLDANGAATVAVAEGRVALTPPSQVGADPTSAPSVAAGQEASVARPDAAPTVIPLTSARQEELRRTESLQISQTLPTERAPGTTQTADSLAAPRLLSPASGTEFNAHKRSSIELRWAPVVGASGYFITLSSLAGGAPREVAQWTTPDPSVRAGSLDQLEPGPYEWAVQAVRTQGFSEEKGPVAAARLVLH